MANHENMKFTVKKEKITAYNIINTVMHNFTVYLIHQYNKGMAAWWQNRNHHGGRA